MLILKYSQVVQRLIVNYDEPYVLSPVALIKRRLHPCFKAQIYTNKHACRGVVNLSGPVKQ